MTGPDRSRLTVFISILVVFAVGLHIVSQLAEVSSIALAPAYMFSPMIAGLVICLRRGIPLSTVGLRIGRAR